MEDKKTLGWIAALIAAVAGAAYMLFKKPSAPLLDGNPPVLDTDIEILAVTWT